MLHDNIYISRNTFWYDETVALVSQEMLSQIDS